MIGLVGAHRTGKTTLAEAWAKMQGVPFLKTSTAKVFELIGCDPAADYSIEERVAIQFVIKDAMRQQYAVAAAKSKIWIADRTPIDMAAYLLADVNRVNALDEGVSAMIEKYVLECFDLTNQYFSQVALVQPGIPYVAEEGKPAPSTAYQEHLNALMFGLIMDARLTAKAFYLRRDNTELETRLTALTNAVGSTMVKHAEAARAGAVVMH